MFDRDKDGFISTQELKKVATMLGTMLTKEEVEDFMAEADMVSLSVMVISTVLKYLSNIQRKEHRPFLIHHITKKAQNRALLHPVASIFGIQERTWSQRTQINLQSVPYGRNKR